jgi:hypothetical protein
MTFEAPQNTPLVSARNRSETLRIANGYKDTTVGRYLVKRGLTLKAAGEESGVPFRDIWNYAMGKRNRVGSQRKRMFRDYLIKIGAMRPRVKRIPKCKNCGIEYPTRRVK